MLTFNTKKQRLYRWRLRKLTLFCITKFVVQLAIDFDCKDIWVHFLQFHILPCCYNYPYTFNNTMKKKKKIGVLFTVDYDQTLWFICIYDFFFNCIVSYQASKIHLLCAIYKCWGWTESTKIYIYSSQKGHDRRKIKRGNDIWLIGRV